MRSKEVTVASFRGVPYDKHEEKIIRVVPIHKAGHVEPFGHRFDLIPGPLGHDVSGQGHALEHVFPDHPVCIDLPEGSVFFTHFPEWSASKPIKSLVASIFGSNKGEEIAPPPARPDTFLE